MNEKKRKKTQCERCLQFGHPKILLKHQGILQRLYRVSAGRKSAQLWEGPLPLLQRTPQDRRQQKMMWRIYNRNHKPEQKGD